MEADGDSRRRCAEVSYNDWITNSRLFFFRKGFDSELNLLLEKRKSEWHHFWRNTSLLAASSCRRTVPQSVPSGDNDDSGRSSGDEKARHCSTAGRGVERPLQLRRKPGVPYAPLQGAEGFRHRGPEDALHPRADAARTPRVVQAPVQRAAQAPLRYPTRAAGDPTDHARRSGLVEHAPQ
jgi:hypothetical protein